MIKYFFTEPYTSTGEPTVRFIFPSFLEKEAEMDDELKNFIRDIKPKEGKVYLLINALSAGEYYGPNKNLDYFPEDALKKYHKTFEVLGGVYKHHKNKPHLGDVSYGKVLFSHYNTKMHRVELIVEVDREKANDIIVKIENGEHVSVSMGCFLPGTGVIINDFSKKFIEDIEVEDEVLTHTGQLHKVIEVHEREYDDYIFIIKPKGKYRTAIKTTKEHPWLVIETSKGRNPAKNLNLNDAVWKTSETLDGTEWLVMPKFKCTNFINCSIEKAKLLGWYLAEGYTGITDNGITFSVGNDDQICDEIQQVLNTYDNNIKLFERPHQASNKSKFWYFFNKDFKNECLKYCGKYAHKKKLHKEIFNWTEEAKLAFLGAYISRDGFTYNNLTYISSCNKQLLEQIQWLANSIDIYTILGKNEHKQEKGFSYHDTTEWILRFSSESNNVLAPYCNKIQFNTTKHTRHPHTYSYNNFYLVGIDSIIKQLYCGSVYNLEVEEDNSYVVENFAVHNCKVQQDYCSVCNNKATKRSEYCQHIKDARLNPIDPVTGKRTYLINLQPKFFDISFVIIPADKTSSVLQKVASVTPIKLAVDIAEQYLRDNNIKEADITKHIEGKIIRTSDDPKGLIESTQEELSPFIIENLLSQGSLAEVLSGLLATRIMPKKRDFQRLLLISLNHDAFADKLDNNNEVFASNDTKLDFPTDLWPSKSNDNIINQLSNLIPSHGMSNPLILIRITTYKANPPILTETSSEVLDKISSLYNTFFTLFNNPIIKTSSYNTLFPQVILKLGNLDQHLLKLPEEFFKETFISAPLTFIKPIINKQPLTKTATINIIKLQQYWKLPINTRHQFFQELIN